eukprot:6064677-Pleurochrysis_carterae.AAC.2
MNPSSELLLFGSGFASENALHQISLFGKQGMYFTCHILQPANAEWRRVRIPQSQLKGQVPALTLLLDEQSSGRRPCGCRQNRGETTQKEQVAVQVEIHVRCLLVGFEVAMLVAAAPRCALRSAPAHAHWAAGRKVRMMLIVSVEGKDDADSYRRRYAR